jgi:hypothetical protein
MKPTIKGRKLGSGGTRLRSWLRHCCTSLKVAGSIADGVIGIFHLLAELWPWSRPSL